MATNNSDKARRIALKGDGNVIGDRNITDNSKKQYNLGCYIPIFLTTSLAIGITVGVATGKIRIPVISDKIFKSATSEPQVKILIPNNGSQVQRSTEISGKFKSLSIEKDLWIYVYATEEKMYYPGKVKNINHNGKTWSFPGLIGDINPDQAGNKWRIGVLVAGQQESEILMQGVNKGLSKLPVETDSKQEIIITRISTSR